MGAAEGCCAKEEVWQASVSVSEAPVYAQAVIANAAADDLGAASDKLGECTSRQDEWELVDKEVIRGIPLKVSLRFFGKLWRTSPIDLKDKECEDLWMQSKPAEYFDVFLSHTWMSSGRWKMISLLIQSSWPFVAFSWACTVLIFCALCLLDILPMPFFYRAEILGFNALCPLGPWLLFPGSLVPALSIFLWPSMPEVGCLRSECCFLDVVSIHQRDDVLKERGIYGLGGFLKVSRELRVLWTTPYPTRLWCMFEVAAYRSVNPQGRINITPIAVELSALVFMLGTLVVSIGLWCRHAAHAARATPFITLSPWAFLACTVPGLFVIHSVRRNMEERIQMIDGLNQFDAEQAGCRSEFDKSFIFTGIQAWFGSLQGFNHYVRTTLRSELLSRCKCVFPTRYLAMILLPPVSLTLEVALGLYKGGAPLRSIMAFAASNLCLHVVWLTLDVKLATGLSQRFYERGSTVCKDFAKSLSIFLAVVIFSYSGLLAAAASSATSEGAVVLWMSTAFATLGFAVWRGLV
ncbi:unnamed protein product [Effrenium voratum]|nr:unnamed protein product [Effrenium voratum]